MARMRVAVAWDLGWRCGGAPLAVGRVDDAHPIPGEAAREGDRAAAQADLGPGVVAAPRRVLGVPLGFWPFKFAVTIGFVVRGAWFRTGAGVVPEARLS